MPLEVRSVSGVPSAGAFGSSTGTPIVVDTSTGIGYVLTAAGLVVALNTPAAGAVTRAMLADGAACSVIGRSANSIGAEADIAASANGNILRRSGNVLGFGQIDLADATNAVSGILAVANGGTGIATTTPYSVICAGTTATGPYQSLAALGASGTVLTSNGASALPSFQALPTSGGITTIASGSLPAAATQDVTSIPATYAQLIIQLTGASSNTATRHPRIQVSTDNGSSFDTTAGNYGAGTEATLIFQAADQAAAATFDATVIIQGYQGGPRMMYQSAVRDSVGLTDDVRTSRYRGSVSAINAIRFLWNGSGNFDAGTYAVYGIS